MTAQEVRILTVRQPWAWAIIHGGKDVENRVRNIAGGYRGPVAIHAAKAVFEEEGAGYTEVMRSIHSEVIGYMATDDDLWEVADDVDPEDPRFIYGEILGVVDLTDVHSASVIDGCGRIDRNCEEHPYGCRHHCSPWAMGPAPEGWYQHLVLANPRPLATPIPYRGALGLRKLPADVAAAVLAPPFPAIGTPVTRTTTSGGEHARTVLWEGVVTAHLKSKVRVRWTSRNGERTVAVLDHYPYEIQEKNDAD